jgi:hypothetical protein
MGIYGKFDDGVVSYHREQLPTIATMCSHAVTVLPTNLRVLLPTTFSSGLIRRQSITAFLELFQPSLSEITGGCRYCSEELEFRPTPSPRAYNNFYQKMLDFST